MRKRMQGRRMSCERRNNAVRDRRAGAQTSSLCGSQASCLPAVRTHDRVCDQQRRQDACEPHRLEACATLRTALCLLVAGLLCTRVFAGAEGDFAVANRAYAEGDFAAALRAYERSLAEELHANALYNLGNTCFRLGKPGPAALSYERALVLQPRQPDAVANLRLAREKSGARLLDQAWWEKALVWFAPGMATAIALGTAWFFTLVAASLAWRKRRGAALWGSVFGVLIAAGYGAATYWMTGERGQIAIVIAERAAVHPEPAEHSPAGESLPGGSQVRVIGESGDWVYCKLPGGQRGWVPAAAVDFLAPRTKTPGRTTSAGAAGAEFSSLTKATAIPATAGKTDWRDELWKRPGTFATLRPAVMHYAFGWSGLTAAEADATTAMSPEGRCVLDFSAKTTGLVRTLWKMDARAVSSCEPATFRPVKLTQTETYKKKVVTTVVDYLADGPVQHRTQEPPEPGPPAVRNFRFPDVHDLNSAVLFIRSQALAQGDSVKLCVYPGGAPYLATATVTGREPLKVAGRDWAAIKCDLKLSRIEDNLTLSPHKKFRKATAWISDDSDRLLLKISAEVQVGSVWAEMQSVGFPVKK